MSEYEETQNPHTPGSTEFMDWYAKQHPQENLDCPQNHRYSTDRGCLHCGYGIWTSQIKCPHCGMANYCAECEPNGDDFF